MPALKSFPSKRMATTTSTIWLVYLVYVKHNTFATLLELVHVSSHSRTTALVNFFLGRLTSRFVSWLRAVYLPVKSPLRNSNENQNWCICSFLAIYFLTSHTEKWSRKINYDQCVCSISWRVHLTENYHFKQCETTPRYFSKRIQESFYFKIDTLVFCHVVHKYIYSSRETMNNLSFWVEWQVFCQRPHQLISLFSKLSIFRNVHEKRSLIFELFKKYYFTNWNNTQESMTQF